ncbi:peptide chain release factor N(5)-glutamine methyltransferase [Clostridium sp. MCC353]|uniref:peptide chain release factor N(5)-glutamine methyltransferase n=1 Tax=Clostridium sp. MCC353 TaxID=2592646 RepID=UPI0031FF38BB|nr:peptide chain release factor N(5)-glutamine methyltransferase [Clostridium sp. MCC353]
MDLTLQGLLDDAAEQLKNAGVPDAALDARLLLFFVFDLDMTRWLMERNRILVEHDREKAEEYRRLVGLRGMRIPLQHLTGSQEFMGLEFMVNRHVLIPRQDTETLVEQVLKDHPDQNLALLDMCTGSGCIAVSLAVLGGYREVVAVDISADALAVAEHNARRLCKKEGQISFIRSDLFEHLPEGRQFDIIVSNPPYIPSEVIGGLEPEVRDHEPALALDGTEDGLYFYRKLAGECRKYLKPGGSIYFEIGWDQADDVGGLLADAGFTRIVTVKDLPGLDRVVKATAGDCD